MFLRARKEAYATIAWQLEPLASVFLDASGTRTRGGFFDALLRDVVNALQNLKAQEALEPVGTFARQVLRHLLQQQAHSCCLQQCPATAAA